MEGEIALAASDWLTVLPPAVALGLALWTRNVYVSLGAAIWLSETLISGFNPAMGVLEGIERAVSVFGDAGNTRILLFCLIIGALIEFMRRSGGISGMVNWLVRSGAAGTRRRAGLVTAMLFGFTLTRDVVGASVLTGDEEAIVRHLGAVLQRLIDGA